MKFLKHLFVICLTVMSLTNFSFADEKEDLTPGLYELKNDVYHEQEIGQNMARTYLNETMELEILQKGDYSYTIEFSGVEYMKDHRILVDDKETDIDIVEETDSNIKIKFDLDSLDSKIKTQIYVDAMERDVEFDIIPDFETVKLIEKYEVADETEEVEAVRDEISDDVSELKSEKVSLYSKYKIPVVAVILLGVIAVTGFVVKRKK
ncbi:MAG: NEAT domain-containing protein [Intestinibacter sp.]|uniref:NEAT domain-containing protein n=1 Tax=Intestinibacter sp. TaxID=1965304 RepID=UPI0025C25BDD|nr:NEAT domain-containing protein [Intestinibacter sp.]MCI6737862.1 NEAT domain-containing protein [Intestinibacter sp.]